MNQRFLGIDYGTRRLGLAASDPLGCTVLPLPPLPYKNEKELLERLGAVIQEKNIGTIVFGEPEGLAGMAGTHAAAVHRFAELCRERFQLNIDFFSEVMTSREAESILIDDMQVPPGARLFSGESCQAMKRRAISACTSAFGFSPAVRKA